VRSPWRFVLLLVALAFLLVGIVTVVGSVIDGGAVVSGVVAGSAGLALGAIGVWRSLVAGVKYSPAGIEVRKLERTSRFSWSDVEAVETRLTPGDFLIFLRQADVVLLLKSGEEEWLTPLAVYTFSSVVPKKVEAKADALRSALDLHLAGHPLS
jgi:hypothetical protein